MHVSACRCNINGTEGNLGCDVVTGECTCKRFVINRDCNQCRPQFWGLSAMADGCEPCNCDPGGSYDNDCDKINGQCSCRPHMTGRTCSQPEPNHFIGYPDFLVYEAELALGSPVSPYSLFLMERKAHVYLKKKPLWIPHLLLNHDIIQEKVEWWSHTLLVLSAKTFWFIYLFTTFLSTYSGQFWPWCEYIRRRGKTH